MSRAVARSKRVVNDARHTPFELALAICTALREREVVQYGAHAPVILEPSAGEGAFIRAAAATWQNARICAVDIDPAAESKSIAAGATIAYTEDCVSFAQRVVADPEARYNLIVGNPPFTYAEEHVRALVPLLVPGGVLAFILRINFFGSNDRNGGNVADAAAAAARVAQPLPDFWRELPEDEFWAICPRPSFGVSQKTGKRGTDGTEYMVCIWRAGAPAHRRRGDPLKWQPPPPPAAVVQPAAAPGEPVVTPAIAGVAASTTAGVPLDIEL